MRLLRRLVARMRRKMTLPPDQAEHMATIKFPCC